MSKTRVIAVNALWNWSGMAVGILGSFIIAPILIRQLGASAYGIWILIGSLTGYFGMLDLGLRGSVGRNMAFYRAKGDQDKANAILSTALAMLSVSAVLALLATAAMLFFFFELFTVPADQVGEVRLALLIAGINLACMLSLNVFDAVLWSLERFDIVNGIDIPINILRVFLTALLINQENGLIVLAAITLGSNVLATLSKAFISFWVDPALHVRLGFVRVETARILFSFGLWSSLLSVARTLTTQASPLIIGARLGVELVTPYNVGSRLVSYAHALMMVGTGVLTPAATALHAKEDHEQQQQLMVQGGKFCTVLSCFFVALFVFLGKPFITLWIGPELASAALLLAILAVGESLALSQYISASIILGMGRPRLLALITITEGILIVLAASSVADRYGLLGICIVTSAAGFLCRGLIQLICVCREIRLSLQLYCLQALLPPLCVAVVPVAAFGLMSFLRPPDNWGELIAYAGAFTLVYGSLCTYFFGYWNLLVGKHHPESNSSWEEDPVANGVSSDRETADYCLANSGSNSCHAERIRPN
jgi:O-antigen/teichoic acid export membrane protein